MLNKNIEMNHLHNGILSLHLITKLKKVLQMFTMQKEVRKVIQQSVNNLTKQEYINYNKQIIKIIQKKHIRTVDKASLEIYSKNFNFFQNIKKSTINHIYQNCQLILLNKNDQLFSFGQKANFFYLVFQGSLEVFDTVQNIQKYDKETELIHHQYLKTIEKGDQYGLFQMDYQFQHNFEVRATDTSWVIKIEVNFYRKFIKYQQKDEFQRFFYVLQKELFNEIYKSYDNKIQQYEIQFLFTKKYLPINQTIIKYGAQSEGVYLIIEGEVEAYQSIDKQLISVYFLIKLSTWGPGQTIGILNIINEEPYQYYVKTVKQCSFLFLEKHFFLLYYHRQMFKKNLIDNQTLQNQYLIQKTKKSVKIHQNNKNSHIQNLKNPTLVLNDFNTKTLYPSIQASNAQNNQNYQNYPQNNHHKLNIIQPKTTRHLNSIQFQNIQQNEVFKKVASNNPIIPESKLEVYNYIVSNEIKKNQKKFSINNIQLLHKENPLITIDRFEKQLIKNIYNDFFQSETKKHIELRNKKIFDGFQKTQIDLQKNITKKTLKSKRGKQWIGQGDIILDSFDNTVSTFRYINNY